ncbi:MAG: hypothetical protein ACLFUO_00855, partial [Candidatus Woesearchaeota archaeon]
SEGWNLVSVPLDMDNLSVSGIESKLSGTLESVYSYEHTDTLERWNFWINDFPSVFNTLDKIDTRSGFWMELNSSRNITFSGKYLSSANYSLKQGWNMIGYPFETGKAFDEFFGSDIDSVISIYKYNPSNGAWNMWVKGFPGNSLDTLDPGYGYWVEMSEDKEIEVNR